MNVAKDFARRLRSIYNEPEVGLHEPTFSDVDKQFLLSCIDSGFVSSVGEHVDGFENDICGLIGSRFSVAVSSGTSGIHLLLHAIGVSPGDEVLIPAISFIATANAVKYCGATPNFVDVTPEHLNMCPIALREYLRSICTLRQGVPINKNSGRPIRAAVAVHVFGRPAATDQIKTVCEEFGIKLIEDAAAALGSQLNGQNVGSSGLGAVFSFNGNKIVTSGGGGVITTDSENLAQKLKHLSTTAKVPHQWEFRHDQIGFNYRLPNINAALGRAQLTKLAGILDRKKNLLSVYKELFSSADYLTFVEDDKSQQSNNWLINIRLTETYQAKRDEILNCLNSEGFRCRPVWPPLHLQPAFVASPKSSLNNTMANYRAFISLPSSGVT